VVEVVRRLTGEVNFDRDQLREEEDEAFGRVAETLEKFREPLRPYWDFD